MYYFIISLATLGILILLMIFKIIFRSPGIFYKIQSINAFTSLSIMFLMIYIYFCNHPEFIDVAFIYIVINYVGMVTILKYFHILYNRQGKKK